MKEQRLTPRQPSLQEERLFEDHADMGREDYLEHLEDNKADKGEDEEDEDDE